MGGGREYKVLGLLEATKGVRVLEDTVTPWDTLEVTQ